MALLVCAAATLPARASLPVPPAWLVAALPGCRLLGQGTFRWWGMDVYRARLWVGMSGIDPGHIGGAPFALQLQYARDLTGRRIADESARLMEQMATTTPDRQRQWLAAMRGIFPDVRRGDTLTGLFDARAETTEFRLDGKPIGHIAGLEFADAFFSIWMSPRTPAPALREELLAGSGDGP
jgi:hypothetical protein